MNRTLQESASWATSLAQNAVSTIREEYKLTFEDYRCRVYRVWENILAIDFPCRDKMHWLAGRLNASFGSEYLVLNLSGEAYDTTKFQGPVMDVKMSKHLPPLDVLLRLCVCANKWLQRSPDRCLVLHGSKATTSTNDGHPLGAVLVFLSCYLCWTGTAMHPKEALLDICSICQVPESSPLPSQRRYMNYFELLHRSLVKTSSMPMIALTRLVLVALGGDGIERLLEVCQDERILFQTELETKSAADVIVTMNVKCRGDVAIRVRTRKAALKETAEQLELQVCFHSSFLTDGFARFPAHEVDQFVGSVKSDCAMDIFFEQVDNGDLKDMHEAQAVAVAAAAVAEGPVTAEEKSDNRDGAEMTPEPNPTAEVFDMTESDSPRIVFKADDIDAFFAEL